MPHQMTQPERVEYMLSALDLSAAKFAKACGLTEATVSRWRSGQCKISQARAHQIEDTFPQFSTSWIMGDTKFTNDTAETFEGSLHRTHPKFVVARQILELAGYTVATPFELSSTALDASTAYLAMVNNQMTVNVARKDDGTACEVYLSDLDAWISKVIASAAESFAPVFTSAEDGTAAQPKPTQWVQIDPECLKNVFQIGGNRQKTAE